MMYRRMGPKDLKKIIERNKMHDYLKTLTADQKQEIFNLLLAEGYYGAYINAPPSLDRP